MLGRVERGHQQGRDLAQLRVGAHGGDKAETVHAGHFDIDQEQRVAAMPRQLQTFFGRRGQHHLVAGRLQDAALEHAGGQRVVHDQNRQGRLRGDLGAVAALHQRRAEFLRIEHHARFAFTIEIQAQHHRLHHQQRRQGAQYHAVHPGQALGCQRQQLALAAYHHRRHGARRPLVGSTPAQRQR